MGHSKTPGVHEARESQTTYVYQNTLQCFITFPVFLKYLNRMYPQSGCFLINNIQLIFGMFSECYTHGGAHPYARCNFPFKYKGKSFDTCTYFNSFDENKAWCSTKKDKNDNHIFESGHWGYCKETSSCPLAGRYLVVA